MCTKCDIYLRRRKGSLHSKKLYFSAAHFLAASKYNPINAIVDTPHIKLRKYDVFCVVVLTYSAAYATRNTRYAPVTAFIVPVVLSVITKQPFDLIRTSTNTGHVSSQHGSHEEWCIFHGVLMSSFSTLESCVAFGRYRLLVRGIGVRTTGVLVVPFVVVGFLNQPNLSFCELLSCGVLLKKYLRRSRAGRER
jgi:hypothetical protein